MVVGLLVIPFSATGTASRGYNDGAADASQVAIELFGVDKTILQTIDRFHQRPISDPVIKETPVGLPGSELPELISSRKFGAGHPAYDVEYHPPVDCWRTSLRSRWKDIRY